MSTATKKTEAATGAEEIVENELIYRFKKPYTFEGVEYTELDLSGLEACTAGTLERVGKIVQKKDPTTNPATVELGMTFAHILAAEVTKKPLEFFHRMPARDAMGVKSAVVGFLYGGDGDD